MIKFELPYNFNFDGKYFNLLDARKEYFQQIDCVYMPSFVNDKMINTRQDLTKYPKTSEEYYNHISEFQKRGINVNILMQRNTTIEDIEKYHNEYYINNFTINDNELALKVKEKYSNIKLRLSITAKATVNDINSKEMDVYDNIVLFFWYNRHLDVIKQLPKNHEYSLLCNTRCMYNCPYCEEHWFGNKINEVTTKCSYQRLIQGHILNFPNVAYIRPIDLCYFEKYISVFKLQGRESSSKCIFADFDRYIMVKKTTIPLHGFNEDNILSNYNK